MSVTAPQAPVAPAQIIPFVQASHEHVEMVAQFNVIPSTSRQNFGPFDVPPYGYLRALMLEVVTTTPGTGGTPVGSADYPFNLIDSLSLNDVNGAPVVGPIDGYALLWTNIVAGTQFQTDPRRGAYFANTATGPSFCIRVPIEITTNDCLGSLMNQDASSTYKLFLTINAGTTVWTTPPSTTYPTIQITVWLEAYTVPNATDMLNNPQQQAPPALGTAQYVTFNTQAVLVGSNTIPIKRVGNLLEALILIYRTGAGARSDTVALNPFTLRWDSREFYQAVTLNYLKQMAVERMNNVTLDTGVYIIPFNTTTLGRLGNGPLRNLWPTTNSSRVEIAGSAAAAGSVQIITVDMSVAQVNPAGRYILDSATGFHANTNAPAQG